MAKRQIKENDFRRKILEKVIAICKSTIYYDNEIKEMKDSNGDAVPPDIPTEEGDIAAYELLKMCGVEQGINGAHIFEIPLCWDNQVVVRYTLGNWRDKMFPDGEKKHFEWWSQQIFDLSAGIGIHGDIFFYDIQWEPMREDHKNPDNSTPFPSDMATLMSYKCPLTDFLTEEEIKALTGKKDYSDRGTYKGSEEDHGSCPYAPTI